MTKFKSLVERLTDQAHAREKQAERARKYSAKPIGGKKHSTKIKVAYSDTTSITQRPHRPWAHVNAGSAALPYQSRATNEIIGLQPWTKELVDILLSAARQGSVHLCLIWPAKVTGLSLLHALADVERVFGKDLRGLRTLFYPGTHTCRTPFHSVLADRAALSTFYRTLWVEQENGSFEQEVHTSSPAFNAVLMALNNLKEHAPDAPNPSLAELVPAFVFDPAEQTWSTTVSNPLERTLAKVRLAFRRELRQQVSLEWNMPDKAPSALMVVHHSAKKDSWLTALTSKALRDQGRPEVLLLDATSSAMRTNYTAVNHAPSFLAFAKEHGLKDSGSVIVTDDPKMFFILRSQLHEARIPFETKVWAAEAEEVLLSPHPLEEDWQPTQRSNSNFSVNIVDRDAAELALSFQRLTATAGGEDTPAHQTLLEACIYILRLSNMPAGYSDLTAISAEEGDSHISQQNAWTPIKSRLDAALSSGALNGVRTALGHTIARAEQLIDDWNDATPMAARMLLEVRKHASDSRKRISLVLPNKRYVRLAHCFLRRQLGEEWLAAEKRIEWHTLSAVGRTLSGEHKDNQLVFIGINPDVLRILLTHPKVPHGTAVLVAYRQAESTLKTLIHMKALNAFKAYRGRIGLLAQELERRLAEVPNPLVIRELLEKPLTFKFEETNHISLSGEQSHFKFELEDGGRMYASGWVYRHVPDEDPPFRRAAASTIQRGDFIFHMSDELRANVESSLQLNDEGVSSVADPVRMLLKLYHNDIQRRCSLMFKATKRSALSREIHAKMVEFDPEAAKCRPGRVYYWLALQTKDNTRPYASSDINYFMAFCRALHIHDDIAKHYWGIVRNARSLNRNLGRELVARYTEILFQPESAAIYRKVPEKVIQLLQQEALGCVYRVERAMPIATRATPN